MAGAQRTPIHRPEVNRPIGCPANGPQGHHRVMRIADFTLERYFAKWEFAVQHVLCASDVEGWSMAELLTLADDETAAMWAGLRLGYTESTGHPLLRRAVAGLYDTLDADDVLTFAGAEEAVFCLMTTSLDPGDHVLVTWPGYQSLYEVARAVGAKVGLHLLREEDGWALDVDRLVRSLHADTRMVVVNAPHNPTGMLPTPEEWRRLAEECSSRGIRLVTDEVYRFLEHDGAPTLPAGADLDERAVSIGVLSKSFALAGLRIGWLATRDRAVLDRCARMKDYTTICSSAPSEVLALIALRALDRVLDRSRSIVAANLAVLDDFFARRADVLSWVRPRGGSTGFPKLVPGGPAGSSADAFAARLVEATGVLLLPSSTFGFGDSHVRIGLGRTDLPVAIQKMEMAL
jgi:aspartate/methionine/tyrosine aminotransferase